METNLEISLLFDFYGEMLSPTQQEAVSLYYNDDLSLLEVAEILKMTRQGVRDALNRAKKSLYNFEDKLRLCDRFEKNRQGLRSIIDSADKLCEHADEETLKLAENIKETAQKLYEQEV